MTAVRRVRRRCTGAGERLHVPPCPFVSEHYVRSTMCIALSILVVKTSENTACVSFQPRCLQVLPNLLLVEMTSVKWVSFLTSSAGIIQTEPGKKFLLTCN